MMTSARFDISIHPTSQIRYVCECSLVCVTVKGDALTAQKPPGPPSGRWGRRLFIEHGYSELSADEIARAARLARGAVYRLRQQEALSEAMFE
jgi:hypothetical protein